MDHGEQAFAVFLDLGPLMTVVGILDRQRMQPEFLAHFFELGNGRIAQGDPDETAGLLQVVADLLDVEVGQLAAILVGDAVDQHGGLPFGIAASLSLVAVTLASATQRRGQG
jgi:hypothetical protein